MDQKTWDAIDAEAEREAEALANARLHQIPHPQSSQSGAITRDQAIWDEHLNIHFTQCSFCGASLDKPGQGDPAHPRFNPAVRTSLFTQDIDICQDCLYLSKQLVRSCPIRSHTD